MTVKECGDDDQSSTELTIFFFSFDLKLLVGLSFCAIISALYEVVMLFYLL